MTQLQAQSNTVGTISLVILCGILCILFAELSGVCVYQFRKETCDVKDGVATFPTDHWGRPFEATYKDPGLQNLTNVTCYIGKIMMDPAIELDTVGIVFHSCGAVSILAIVMYCMVIFLYICFVSCCYP